MYLPRSLFLLPFIAYTAAAAAAAATLEKRWPESNLTLELSSYVPVCAEDCFISFLQATFGLERGQRIPSLQELCSTDGETGFTVGEGAVQCIAAERSIDGCSDQDANCEFSLSLCASFSPLLLYFSPCQPVDMAEGVP